MKIYYTFIFWQLFLFYSYSQSTFEYLYSTSNNEFSYGLAEDAAGNIFIPVINYQYALILKLDAEGSLLDSLIIIDQDGTCSLDYLIELDENQFGALGHWDSDSTVQLWYVQLDNNFNVINDKKINSNNCLIGGFQSILNNYGNIVFSAGYIIPDPLKENVCMYEITPEGELIRNHFFNTPAGFNVSCALLENKYDSTYKVITTSPLDTIPSKLNCFINLVDTNFNLLDYGLIHNNYLKTRASAMWMNDSIYLLAGKWLLWNRADWDIGILKVTRNDSILAAASFGKLDTTDWPGNYKCIDFISNNNIFFVGTNNTYSGYFQNSPSSIMVNILDSDLNLKNQLFYGEEAYYNVMSVLATRDSGCVISCTRYDYINQTGNYDVYILKVNKDGLLVSVPDDPVISQSFIDLYPNPGKDNLYIESKLDNLYFEFFDVNMKPQLKLKLESGRNVLNVSRMPGGIYLYRVFDKKNQLVQSGKWLKY